jgi:recombination protein RecR
MENLPKHLEQSVDFFSSLPGIGKKTALRLVLHLLKQDKDYVLAFSESLKNLKESITNCKNCFNISDTEICHICTNPNRNKSIICVVEDIRDVIAIENTSQFSGNYHVLGGLISPINGIGPNDLTITPLLEKLKTGEVKEVILALSTTMEGDTTGFYLFRKLKDFDIEISIIARGIAFGDELEYADEVTLGKSIANRTPYEKNILN